MIVVSFPFFHFVGKHFSKWWDLTYGQIHSAGHFFLLFLLYVILLLGFADQDWLFIVLFIVEVEPERKIL